MPELPEVETIARQLNGAIKGQKIKTIQVRRKKSFPGRPRDVVGRKIGKVSRRAKILIIELSGDINLLIHLKMTGQLIYDENDQFSISKFSKKYKDHRQHFKFDLPSPRLRQGKSTRIVGGHPTRSTSSGQAGSGYRIVGGHPTADWVKALPSSHTRVVLTLSKGTLFFNDMRVFGWVKVVKGDQIEQEFKNFGPDVTNTKTVTSEYFYDVLQSSRRAVKTLITDQGKVAGVGNIYANDGLFCAGIDPRRPANELTEKESGGLLRCLIKILKKGIKYGGASESDFVHTSGLGGKYQEHFLVYAREGERCQRRGCRGMVKKIKLGGRGTYFCPKCQK